MTAHPDRVTRPGVADARPDLLAGISPGVEVSSDPEARGMAED